MSALGLRHFGYAIPTNLFGPFVTASLEVRGSIVDQVTSDSFQYSLGFVAQNFDPNYSGRFDSRHVGSECQHAFIHATGGRGCRAW